MITSPAVWAIIAAHFSENWGFYTMLTQLPTFMNGKYIKIYIIIYPIHYPNIYSLRRRVEFQTGKDRLPLGTALPSNGNSLANFGSPSRLAAFEKNFNHYPSAQTLELRCILESDDFYDLHGLYSNANRIRRVYHRCSGSRRICMVWIQVCN